MLIKAEQISSKIESQEKGTKVKEALELAYRNAIERTAAYIVDSTKDQESQRITMKGACIALEATFGEVLGYGFIRIVKDMRKEIDRIS